MHRIWLFCEKQTSHGRTLKQWIESINKGKEWCTCRTISWSFRSTFAFTAIMWCFDSSSSLSFAPLWRSCVCWCFDSNIKPLRSWWKDSACSVLLLLWAFRSMCRRLCDYMLWATELSASHHVTCWILILFPIGSLTLPVIWKAQLLIMLQDGGKQVIISNFNINLIQLIAFFLSHQQERDHLRRRRKITASHVPLSLFSLWFVWAQKMFISL